VSAHDAVLAASRGEARLTPQAALWALEHADFLELGASAAHARARLVPGDDVTFIVDRNVNYTNVCVSGCRFCAFYASPGSAAAYVLSREELADKVAETIDLEGTAILLQGGMHPDLDIEWYEQMLAAIKEDHPEIHVHGFGPPEVVHIARLSGISAGPVPPSR
jgi:cyclic dehypoxanthinyl futalosine synthase